MTGYMDTQTLAVLVIVAVAALYVSRSLWPTRKQKSGCSSCPQNHSRVDDYA
ncbi:MAG: FeoB-associated Cys-rich membrane protein [Deltaproteobacteria bacterium]|nr:FeoB-associated Cys-rich membrane protein [Deltaproteobacteria bacterium]